MITLKCNINNMLLKKKKNFFFKKINKNINFNKSLLKLNLIKEIKNNQCFFSLYKNKLKIKKLYKYEYRNIFK
jgi:hypothetical protein